MRGWLLPILTGACVTIVTFQVALVNTPRFLMAAAVRRVGQTGANRFFHGPLATDQSRAIVRPSPDLAYSSCPFDLRDGPVALHAAPTPAPYWSLSVFDARTDTAFVRNNGESGDKPIDVVIARPGQPVPVGREVVRVEGARGIALIRVLVEDRARFPAIDAARRQSRCGRL